MKYDCNKALDYAREVVRMCNSYLECEDGCPFNPMRPCDVRNVTQERIDAVQRWSDEHPEQPKLTKKEYEFLSAFPYIKGMLINRTNKGLYFVIHRFAGSEPYTIHIDDNMFSFIPEGEEWYFDKLLGLEVEEC